MLALKSPATCHPSSTFKLAGTAGVKLKIPAIPWDKKVFCACSGARRKAPCAVLMLLLSSNWKGSRP
jgi:hypothetical protein